MPARRRSKKKPVKTVKERIPIAPPTKVMPDRKKEQERKKWQEKEAGEELT